jgi:hypothetical protein
MGRNAAFGRPSVSVRARRWWDSRDRATRQNVFLALGVGALFVAIILAAVNRDPSPSTSRVISSRPQATTTTLGFTPSTVFVGNLGAAGSATATGLTVPETTTTTAAPAPTAPPTTRRAPAPATTAVPAPATTVTNPNVIYTEVPVETTTTRPPTSTTTSAPTTTVAPTTTSTLLAPIVVPGLLGP